MDLDHYCNKSGKLGLVPASLERLCSVTEPHITLNQLHGISCPTLVIDDYHDVIRPVHSMVIAQHIPKSYLWILPNSGHSMPIVYRDGFNQHWRLLQ